MNRQNHLSQKRSKYSLNHIWRYAATNTIWVWLLLGFTSTPGILYSQDYPTLMEEAAKEMRKTTIVQMVEKNGDRVTKEIVRQIENCQLGKKYPVINTLCDDLAKARPPASNRSMLTNGLDDYKEKCLDAYKDFKPEKDKKGVKKKNLEGKLNQLVQQYLEKVSSEQKPEEQKKEEPKKEEKEELKPPAWHTKIDQELSGLNTPLKKLNRLSELHSQYQGDNNENAARYAMEQMAPQLQALAADQSIPLAERKKILQHYTENFRNTNAGKTAETLLKGLNEIKPISPKPKTPNPSPVSIFQLLKPARTLSDSVNMLRKHQGREEVQQLLARVEQQLRQRCKNAYSKSDNAVTLRLLNLYLAVFPKGDYAAEAKALQGALVPTVVNLKDQEAWAFALAAEGTQRLSAFEAYLNYRDAKGQPGFYHQACQDSIDVIRQRNQLAQDIDAATTIQKLATLTTEAERLGVPELAFKADDKAWGIATQTRTEEAYRQAFDGKNGRPRGIYLDNPIPPDPTPWWVWGAVGLLLLSTLGWLGRKKIRAFFVKKPDKVPDSPGPALITAPINDPPAQTVIPPPNPPSKEEIKTQEWQEAKHQDTLEAYIGFYRNYPDDRAARKKIDDWIVLHEKDINALEGGLPLLIGTPWKRMVQQALEALQTKYLYSPEPHPNGFFDRHRFQESPEGCLFKIAIKDGETSGSFLLIDSEEVVRIVINNGFANVGSACQFSNYHLNEQGRARKRIKVKNGTIALEDRRWVITKPCEVEFLD